MTEGRFAGTRGDMVQGSEYFENSKKKIFCIFVWSFSGTPKTDVGHKGRILS